MTDTVRDAVFGNVGTIICFRVSADDAPILAKQFEPQFEPTDLLQMHNRSFIINMVISGEKSPAFSATTLTLPPPQIDNTGRIIESTRRTYSRSRAEIEQEISLAIQPPQHLQSNRPQSTAQARQWPINAQSQTVTPRPVATEQGTAPAPGVFGSDPTKKKRTRTRKRKPSTPAETLSQAPTTSGQSDSNELYLH